MQKLSRREALRGTGVAALAASVAMVPAIATARTDLGESKNIGKHSSGSVT